MALLAQFLPQGLPRGLGLSRGGQRDLQIIERLTHQRVQLVTGNLVSRFAAIADER